MHIILIFVALVIAWAIRIIPLKSQDNWQKRGRYSLFFFVFPPSLLIMTALAVICMGYQGKMLGFPASWFSYLLALSFIIFGIVVTLKLTYQAWLSLQQIHNYPQELVRGKVARILDISFPYTAQIGFWQPELVISNGLIQLLSPRHLEAVLAHEEAHNNYRDTFWFFWLGCIKNLTCWLPNTDILWEELLLLRELRADGKAAQKVDSLLLAESLLIVTQASINLAPNFNESFSCAFSNHRLTERIDALLTPSESHSGFNVSYWNWILLTLLPWLTLPFHY